MTVCQLKQILSKFKPDEEVRIVNYAYENNPYAGVFIGDDEVEELRDDIHDFADSWFNP